MENNTKVQAYFERANRLFNSIYTGEKSAFGRYLDKVLRPDMKKRFVLTVNEIQKRQPQRLIDIGIGPGQYLKAYTEIGVPCTTALDFSAPMLDLAKELVGELPSGVEVEYVVEDFMDTDLEHKYDIAVAMGVLDYIRNPLEFISKIRQSITDCALISFPSISIWRTPIRKMRYWYKRCPVFFYTRNEIEVLARDAGFRSSYIHKIRGSGMDFWARFEV